MCYCRMLKNMWTACSTNISILKELSRRDHEGLLRTIQRQIVKLFCHVIGKGGIEKILIRGEVDGKRNRGRPPVRLINHTKHLTNMLVSEVMRVVVDDDIWNWISITEKFDLI